MEHIIKECLEHHIRECLICGSTELAGECPGEYQEPNLPDYPPLRDGVYDTPEDEEDEPEQETVQRGLF